MISEWVAAELCGVDFGDSRLNDRVMHLTTAIAKKPSDSFGTLFPTHSELLACYRFFDNDLVNEEKINSPHFSRTIDRIKEHAVVLHLSDTTSLNYTSRKSNKDTGYLSTDGSQGFFLQASIVVTPSRLPLGVVEQHFWSREKQKPKDRIHRNYMPLQDKESYRWLQSYKEACELAGSCKNTQIVHITDREGDLFEVFIEYQSQSNKADFIVRRNHDRVVYSKGRKIGQLNDVLKASKILGEVSFELISREDDSKRTVRQTVQAIPVTFSSQHDEFVQVNAILLNEIDPPEGTHPVTWCLLTSLPIDSLQDILTIVQYYLCRWEIEVFFKTFKVGCKVEEKSLRTAERLFPLFSLFLIVAWRVNYLMHLGRLYPEISCISLFEEAEWKSAYAVKHRTRIPLNTPLSLGEMIELITHFGGYKKRKNSPPPGPKAMWIGLSCLAHYAEAWNAFGPDSK